MSNMRSKLMAGLKKRESSMLSDPHLDRIGKAVQKSKTPLSKEKIYDVPLSAIKDNPFQYRTEESLDSTDLKSLAQSIAEHGLRSPIQLRRVDEGYQLVAGWRRLTAIRRFLKSMTTVKATIDETMTDKTHRLLTVLENEQREDFTVFEKAKAYNDMREMDGLSTAQIAEFVGSSKTRVIRILKLLKLNEGVSTSLRKATFDGLSTGHLDEIVAGYQKRIEIGISTEDSSEWVDDIVQLVLSGSLTIADIREENKKPTPNVPEKKSRTDIKISGGEWKTFKISPDKKVTLQFQLPEEIDIESSDAVIGYIKEQLLH